MSDDILGTRRCKTNSLIYMQRTWVNMNKTLHVMYSSTNIIFLKMEWGGRCGLGGGGGDIYGWGGGGRWDGGQNLRKQRFVLFLLPFSHDLT